MVTNPIFLKKIRRGIGSTNTIISLLENIKEAFPDVKILILTFNGYGLKQQNLLDFMRKYKRDVKVQPLSSEVMGYRFDIAVVMDMPYIMEDRHMERLYELEYVAKYIIIEKMESEERFNDEIYSQ